MNNMKELVLIGKLQKDDDGNVAIKQKEGYFCEVLAEEIGHFIEENNDKTSAIYSQEVVEDLGYSICIREDNIQLRFYVSDNKIESREKIEEKYLQKMFGSIDIAVENLGYSEYTITGYNVSNFMLGEHDLEKIFSNYLGKYVCIIVEKVSDRYCIKNG